MKLLILGDFHISEHRKKAIELAISEIKKHISPKDRFDYIVILGDLFNKYPTITERIVLALFLNFLCEFTDEIIIIKGTDSHDFTSGEFNIEDLLILNALKIKAVKQFKVNNFLFIHEPVKGLKFDNGIATKEGLDISKIKEYVVAGHYHTPQDHVVGSIYKTTFAQKDNQKRIVSIKDTKIEFLPIASRDMYEVNLVGKKNKITCKEIKLLKELPKGAEIDLKINAKTDSESLLSINSNIAKIKAKFNIEYYQEDIEIKRLKTDIPKNLNEQDLLKKYCKKQKIDYKLVEKEIKK